jgi:hypothetical protein
MPVERPRAVSDLMADQKQEQDSQDEVQPGETDQREQHRA